jgi:hypothetical protein
MNVIYHNNLIVDEGERSASFNRYRILVKRAIE